MMAQRRVIELSVEETDLARLAAMARSRTEPASWVERAQMLLDEPTAALAVREVEHVLDLIRNLKGHGIAVILISHRLTDVFSVCDRIVVLRQGTVIADDATQNTSMNAVVAHIVGATDAPHKGANP